MKYQNTSVGGGVEILAAENFDAIPVEVAMPVGGSTVVKAGTPLTEEGVSTTGAGAIGILLYDVDAAENPNGAAVVHGIIDAAKAQAHSGVSYAAALYSALPGIVFRTNIGVKGVTGATGATGATGET